MDRKLASIQRIKNIRPIPNADNIVVAEVLGWECVTQKSNNFQVGDLVCYFEVDSVLPQRPEFAFLADRNYRIRTIRLRGQISQGLILPLDDETYRKVINTINLENSGIRPGTTVTFDLEGMDVTELLGVTKYEIPIAPEMMGQVEGAFPGWIKKTDEHRIQSNPGLIQEMWGLPYYITQKLDGTSATYALDNDGKFIVCSRNLSLKPSGSIYWQIAEKYKIEEVLRNLGNGFVIQGEIVGPGIQQNRLGLKEHEFYFFTVSGSQNPLDGFYYYALTLPLFYVPILESGESFHYEIPELLELAKGKYANGQPQEGIVVRPKRNTYSKFLNGNLSFKVLNNDWLVKEK